MPKVDSSHHVLSKTSFIKSIQCLKQLYLYKNRYFLRDKLTPEQLAIFKRGHVVGELAWELFPGGIDASPKSPMQYEKALALTQTLIAQNQSVIYEASFRFNQCLSILDVLVIKNNQYLAYEVKSSLSITETYLQDAAFQYYVMSGAGYTPTQFYLIYVNTEYVHKNPINVSEYFVIEEVTEKLIALQPLIISQVEKAKETIHLPKSPQIEIGIHCQTPYRCDFFGFCRKYLPQSNIFSLTDLPIEEQYQFYAQRKIKLSEIQEHEISLEIAKKQLFSHKNQQELFDDFKSELHLENVHIGYFVWSSPAIPLIEGDKPYTPKLLGYFEQTIHSESKDFTAFIYQKGDDYLLFLQNVKNSLLNKQVVTFDSTFCEPLFVEEFQPISITKMLKNKNYYHPKINGDYSFENIASALIGISNDENRNSKSAIFHHEGLKTSILNCFETDEPPTIEAQSYIAQRIEKTKLIWLEMNQKRHC